MVVGDVMVRLGGVATRAALVRATSRADVDRALHHGEIVAVARGRYAMAGADAARTAAHAVGGVLSHESAALYHGWGVKEPPPLPDVTVRRSRAGVPGDVRAHYIDLLPEDVVDGVTRPEVTLEHCLRSLPFDAALAVADSALREGLPPSTLVRVARSARGPHSARMRRVAAEASGEAANPFESVLRAIASDVPGLAVVPQRLVRVLGRTYRPDLVDEDLGVVLEADSFLWHGDRAALRRDCRRYDLLVAGGWTVLRFAWEDVMHDQEFVRLVLTHTVELVHQRAQRPASGDRSA